jgi:triphosphatase
VKHQGNQKALQNALDHFIANWAALRESQNSDAVHRLRVALRRLRSALGMFKVLAPSPALESFGRQAKEIGADLSRARQCDVFMELAEGPKAWMRDDEAFVALDATLEKETTAAYVRARAAIESAKSSIFVIELQAQIAQYGWRSGLAADQVQQLELPGREVAVRVLDRLYKRVRRRGENLTELPAAERHELRVALKKLRYGAEFLRPYFRDERGARAFNREAANLQEVLGALNDVAEAGGVLKTLKAETSIETARSAGLILGWYGHNAAIAENNLLKTWKAFNRAGPFWR